MSKKKPRKPKKAAVPDKVKAMGELASELVDDLDLSEKGGERGTHMFFGLCTLLVISFFVWSALGRLDVVSAALGEVIPSTQVKRVQHLDGGRLCAHHD